jgi:NaMN:DMB phosphoribosyltransferase
VLRRALERHATVHEPLAVLAALGGLEIATLAGAVLQAAQERRLVVVDGFITTAAVAVAAACSRVCCSVACLRTARPKTAMAAGSWRWGPGRCWTWACAWVKARARRWPGR